MGSTVSPPTRPPLSKQGGDPPPMVGSLFSWKSLFTNRRTREDYRQVLASAATAGAARVSGIRTFPTAASPSSTSLTLLLGLLAAPPESAMSADARRRARWSVRFGAGGEKGDEK